MFVVRKGIMTIPDKTSASITNIQSPIKQDMFFAKMSYLLYSIINNSVFNSVLPTNTIWGSKLEKALTIFGFFEWFFLAFSIFQGVPKINMLNTHHLLRISDVFGHECKYSYLNTLLLQVSTSSVLPINLGNWQL